VTGSVTVTPAGTDPTPAQVARVRAFNRFYTNVIGVLNEMYLDTPYTLTESRLLYEIVGHGAVEVSWLRQALDIDAGYLSRVLTRFESEGLVTRHRSAADARRQEIRATDAGRAAQAELDARAAGQIGALLRGVDCGRLVDAMGVITGLLGRPAQPSVTLRPLAAGDLGWVLRRHGTRYAAEFGWDATFEDFCARIIGEYTTLHDRFPGRTGGWIAEVDGVPAGSVFCAPDGEATARLRLLLVEPWARGLGLGRRLVDHCLDFARDAGYAGITLLTYDQLVAARRIYRAAGFTLDSEHREDAFGQQMMSQTWSRPLTPG
jgi:DNA-binding MarR family transcriptional regulator/GNAT superfamily N-acetyltransferase